MAVHVEVKEAVDGGVGRDEIGGELNGVEDVGEFLNFLGVFVAGMNWERELGTLGGIFSVAFAAEHEVGHVV